jgi:hypothetical protein
MAGRFVSYDHAGLVYSVFIATGKIKAFMSGIFFVNRRLVADLTQHI